MDATNPNRGTPIRAGLVVGLLLAATIATLRQRWTARNDETPPSHSMRTTTASGLRFGKLALWMTVTGASAGLLVLWLTPARYLSDALVSFENEKPGHAAVLIESATDRDWSQIAIEHGLYGATRSMDGAALDALLSRSRRDLTWRQLEAGGAKTDTFNIQFASEGPALARAVLQDLLRAVDQTLLELHGVDETPYEAIRGVDGSLITVTGGDLSAGRATDFPGADLVGGPRPAVAPVASFSQVTPIGGIAIPFDDARAQPVPQPEYRSVRMNVIDAPGLPSDPEGLRWWTVAIGGAAGLLLAALLSLLEGVSGFAARRDGVVVGASLP